jgi:anti-sigma factor RsiW
MTCELWLEKLDAHLDGELSAEDARAWNDHLKQCPSCTAEALRRVQQKRAVHAAAQKFVPSAAFRARVLKQTGPVRTASWTWRWLPILATVAAVLIVGALFFKVQKNDQRVLSELVDQHVATLASANPVDVVSTDRHTVKPWFEGKIPFTFNLPELQGSPFTLVGGKVSYLRQLPGAELIFRVRQHQISVFIFQEQGIGETNERKNPYAALSFEVRSWQHNGLRYFMIGDASAQDLDQLSELIKSAR